jgi:hypothetical protein
VRQFACTGGTLISKALQAQPNTLLLSEVDPLNVAHRQRRKPGFCPTDLIQMSDTAVRPLDDAIKLDIFRAGLSALHAALNRQGRRLVLREHSHGRFCTQADWTSRQSLGDILAETFPLRTILTVRHPLDSWLSLIRNDWRHFSPFTLEEYARRYAIFLDTADGAPVFAYESFVADPETELEAMCAALELPVNEDWQALLPAISLSGDSGRSGSTIGPRERRSLPAEVVDEAKTSRAYAELCTRLGYNPDPSSQPGPPTRSAGAAAGEGGA